jgi:poly(3-hydroxybutyrate) depolymerase
MLYGAYQAQLDAVAPVKALANVMVDALEWLPPRLRNDPVVRWLSANNEMIGRSGLTHQRPSFGIDSVKQNGRPVPVREEVVMTTPFGSLIHFAKETEVAQPKVLVVAALAGHFSTLLGSTVRALSEHHDVFITDWHNARDVPLAHGAFGFDDYVDHVIDFVRAMGTGVHVVAVCQPCPATLAAVALMADERDPATPVSLTLMAGPVDGRISPTAINNLATEYPLSWFRENVIGVVPSRYAGAGRRVYPGFLQLGGFVAMNWATHVDRQLDLFHDLIVGNKSRSDATMAFYDEYCAVLDLPAEFYLETVDRVFQRFLLPKGELEVRGRRVELGAIRTTALLTIEGARDDICGLGQTMVAQDLCSGIPRKRRRHHLQAGVGHYGVFSGSAWERQICPVIDNFILANDEPGVR